MKTFKVFFMLLVLGTLAGVPGVVSAQVVNPAPLVNPNGLAIDTGSQAAAEGPKTLAIKGTQKTFSIVVKTLKISGTIAGTVAWQGSNDGITYATISTTTLVDASTNYEYKETDKGFLYYKALITQTGTSSLSYSAVSYTTSGPLK